MNSKPESEERIMSIHQAIMRDDSAELRSLYLSQTELSKALTSSEILSASALEIAIIGNKFDAASTLIDLGADVNQKNEEGEPLLVNLSSGSSDSWVRAGRTIIDT